MTHTAGRPGTYVLMSVYNARSPVNSGTRYSRLAQPMSLTSLLRTPEVTARLKPLRPKGRRVVRDELVAPAHTKRFSLVGVAFDYLLRFELQRRVPRAVVRPWAAEDGLNKTYSGPDGFAVPQAIMITGGPLGNVSINDPDELRELHERLVPIVERAGGAVKAFIETSSTGAEQIAEMAHHALQLSHLDFVLRSRMLAADFDEVRQEDIDDLVGMLDVVPFGLFTEHDPLLLNPIFGGASHLVGGADADLVVGTSLYDVKVTTKAVVKTEYIDQLLGYFLLAERHRAEDSSFPSLQTAGIYFARHACSWTMETSVWTDNPQFAETADWFFTFAEAV
jgi:hypothetical protein